jgi:hypothetical protein
MCRSIWPWLGPGRLVSAFGIDHERAGLGPSKWPGLGGGSVPPHQTRHASGLACKVLVPCSLGVIDDTITRCRPFAPTRGHWLAPLVSPG